MAKNDGKELENALQQALKQHAEDHKTTFGRFYDATSSGGRGHTQSGDFFWLIPGKSVLIECKSTVVGAEFLKIIRSSKTSRAQTARHKLWHLAKHPSVYFWLDVETREVRAYDGASVVSAVASNKKDTLILIAVSGISYVSLLLDKAYDYLQTITED